MPVPEFIAALRGRIGTDPLWLPGVSGVVVDEHGRVLLGRRADNGLWAVPSGIPEPGEEPAVALAREVLEETGVVVEVLAVAAVSTSDPVTYPNGDRARYLDVCFVCRPVSGEARVADDESLDVGWFDPDQLPEPVAAGSARRVAHGLAAAAALAAGGPAAAWFVAPGERT